jgi:hypothetical protein
LITSVKKINNCSLRHFYKFDEKRARTPRWVIRFTSKLQVKKKIDRGKWSQSHIFRGSKGVGVTIESYEKLEISYINVDNF